MLWQRNVAPKYHGYVGKGEILKTNGRGAPSPESGASIMTETVRSVVEVSADGGGACSPWGSPSGLGDSS